MTITRCTKCGAKLTCASCNGREGAKKLHQMHPELAREAGKKGGRPRKAE